jgi:hypothetical protein
MHLAHRRLEFPAPLAIALAELAIRVPARMCRAILLPQQRERHAGLLELLVDVGPVRHDPIRGQRGAPKQARFQRAVVDLVGQAPAQAGGRGALEVRGHGAESQPACLRDGALRETGVVF